MCLIKDNPCYFRKVISLCNQVILNDLGCRDNDAFVVPECYPLFRRDFASKDCGSIINREQGGKGLCMLIYQWFCWRKKQDIISFSEFFCDHKKSDDGFSHSCRQNNKGACLRGWARDVVLIFPSFDSIWFNKFFLQIHTVDMESEFLYVWGKKEDDDHSARPFLSMMQHLVWDSVSSSWSGSHMIGFFNGFYLMVSVRWHKCLNEMKWYFVAVAMEFLSISIPLWAIFLLLVIVVLLVWQFIRFTIRLLLFFLLFFALLIGLDLLGVFTWIQQNILSSFL